jgi:hypothetical protein
VVSNNYIIERGKIIVRPAISSIKQMRSPDLPLPSHAEYSTATGAALIEGSLLRMLLIPVLNLQ